MKSLRALLPLTIAVVVMVLGSASPARAAAAPAWRIYALTDTTAEPGGTTSFFAEIANFGEGEASGTPVEFTVSLPAGLKATSVVPVLGPGPGPPVAWSCAGTAFPAGKATCADSTDPFSPNTAYDHITLRVSVAVSAALSPGAIKTARFEVSGGGGAPQQTAASVRIGPELGFGLSALDGVTRADAGGAPSTQAGAHPDGSSVSFELNTHDNGEAEPLGGALWPVAPVRDAYANIPAGLVGNPSVALQCTTEELDHGTGTGEPQPLCPPGSQVGVVTIRTNASNFRYSDGPNPVFNMVPPAGVPARFGFNVLGTAVVMDAKLRSSGDYGLTIVSRGIPEGLALAGTTVTLWGVPASAAHDPERACPGYDAPFLAGAPHCPSSLPDKAFLRNPTSCNGAEALRTTLSVDSWPAPGRLAADGLPDLSDPAWSTMSFLWHDGPGYPYPSSEWGAPVQMEGCEKVPVKGVLSAQATSTETDASTGLGVALEVPNPGLENPSGIASSDLKGARVTLPEGVTINPSQAGGLGVCTPQQFASEEASLHPDPSHGCPADSKIGSVEVHSQLVSEVIGGDVYIAAPYDNPFGSLLALYIALKSPERGILVKIPGRVETDPVTGRIVTTFENLPQLPFEKFVFHFKEGPRAPLVTPPACGSYQTEALLDPWSDPSKPLTSRSTMQIAHGNGGGACPVGALPLAPSLVAGSIDPVAAAYTPFYLRLSRRDGEQQLAALSPMTLPPGLLADIGAVPRCSDAQVAAAACPVAARLGSIAVSAGAGAEPVQVTDGNVYLTGPYRGAPFGLAFVVHAKAGPFDLGMVVVRAALRIDPRTAQVRVQTDPFPTILQGIPVRLRDIRVSIDRARFMLNPTSCAPMQIAATVAGTQGGRAQLSNRFQVGECEKLRFTPKLTASTSARVSRTQGASLNVTVAYPKGAQANIRSVKVKLPRQLASRLTTLQQACPDATFAANPGSCPAGSVVGGARALSPILAAPLAGPAYFVSHGGAKFPELEIVLQGEGVTIELGGETFIDQRTNVTSSTFRAVPDAPVSSFTLSLPRGPHSALGSLANLCRARLVMPTAITAQNGAVIKQNTKIAVSGCGKRKGSHRQSRRK